MSDDVRHIKVHPAEKKSEAKVGLVFVVLLSLAIVALWVVKARKHDPRDLEMMKAASGPSAATPTPAAGTVPELSLSSTVPLAKERMDEVSRALAPAVAKAASCMQGVYGTAFVDVVLASTGEVKEARFSTRNTLPVAELLKDTCVLSSLREPKISAGQGEITASFPVRNMPSSAMMKDTAQGIVDGKIPVVTPK